MTTSNKKLLLTLGAVIGASSVVAGLTTAYFLSPNIKRISLMNTYTIKSNTNANIWGYKFDLSDTYGSPLNQSVSSILMSGFIRVASEGKMEVAEDGTIKNPSQSYYEFELSDSIVLEFTDNSGNKINVEFNSDDHEIPGTGNGILTTVNKTSNNKNSINSAHFADILSLGTVNVLDPSGKFEPSNIVSDANGNYILTSVNFGFPNKEENENVNYWIDSNGNKTEYEINANDFFYSFMRTNFHDTEYRRNNGSNKALDAYYIKKNNATMRFQEEDRYPNGYLMELFGINLNNLFDKTKTVRHLDVDGKKTQVFSFYSSDPTSANGGFASLISKIITNNLTWSPAPSKFIEEQVSTKEWQMEFIDSYRNAFPEDKKTDEEIIALNIYQYGIYQYGVTRSDVLYSSAYYPDSSESSREIFKYNKHYSNQEWVNLPNKIETFVFEYAGGIESETFNSISLNSLLNGTLSQVDYSLLSDSQKLEVYGKNGEDAKKNGLQTTKKMNKSSLVQRTLVQSNPTATKNVDSYGFNNGYAELVFGSSLTELANGTADTSDSFFFGDGAIFRNLISSSINWHTYIYDSSNGTNEMWLSNTAPDARFSSTIEETPSSYIDEVNTLIYYALDASGNKIRKEITPEQQLKHFNENKTSAKVQLQSPDYNIIKTTMKALLDKNNITGKGFISWEIVYPWTDNNQIKINALQRVVNLINSLDDRLNATLLIPNTHDVMVNRINSNFGVSDFNGWNYDYEGIGTYLDAFMHGKGVTLLPSIPNFSSGNPDSNIQFWQTEFPAFTKFCKALKLSINDEIDKVNASLATPIANISDLYVENWAITEFPLGNSAGGQTQTFKITSNLANNDLDAFFNLAQESVGIPSDKQLKLGTVFAKSILDYQESFTTAAKVVELIKELNFIKGVSINSGNETPLMSSTTPQLIMREYIVPVTSSGITYAIDTRIDKRKI